MRARHNPQVSGRPKNVAMMKGASRQVGLLCIMAHNPPTPVANAAQLYLVRNKLGSYTFSTQHVACKATKKWASELPPARAGLYTGVPNLLEHRTALWWAAGTTKGFFVDLLWQITPQMKSEQLLPSFKSKCTSPAAT